MRGFTTAPCVLFTELFDRPLIAAFDVPNASSDRGGVLLKAAERRLDLIQRLAAALVDERQAGKVRHGSPRVPTVDGVYRSQNQIA